MPNVGLGTGSYGSCTPQDESCCASKEPQTWRSDLCPGVTKAAVYQWLRVGGRRIDGANDFGNQREIAAAIKEAGVSSEETFIVSKVGSMKPMGYNETLSQTDDILTELDVHRIDLLLVHWPFPGPHDSFNSTDPPCKIGSFDEKACRLSTWRAMLEVLSAGKARAVGVSNYNVTHLQEIADAGLKMPAVNQVPYTPHLARVQRDVIDKCKEHDIVVNGYSPFGTPDYHSYSLGGKARLLDEEAITKLAAEKNRTAAEVVLAWNLARGVLVNPRTQSEQHMRENLVAAWNAPFLTEEELSTIEAMQQDDCTRSSWFQCEGTHGNNGNMRYLGGHEAGWQVAPAQAAPSASK